MMVELDALAPNYRRARDRWPNAPTLERSYDSLHACFGGTAHGLVEHAKALLECVCITILGEFRRPLPSNQPTTTELLVSALAALGLSNSRGAAKLDKVLSGFNRLADAISEMRNETGPVAHGKDGFVDAIAADHARVFLHAGDAILSVLLNAVEGKQPDLMSTREPYESFPHLNGRIDRAVTVDVRIEEDEDRQTVILSVSTGPRGETMDLSIEPSRLLYGIDRAAYVEILRSVGTSAPEDLGLDDSLTDPVAVDSSLAINSALGHIEVPILGLVAEYSGNLETIRGAVVDFLKSEGVDPTSSIADGAHIVDSLLRTAEHHMPLDWKMRDVMQARLKVALKRVLIRFGLTAKTAEAVARRFVSWLQVQAPYAPVGPSELPSGASLEGT